MRRLYKLLLFLIGSLIFLSIVFCVRLVFLFSLKNPQRSLSQLATLWASVMVWILDISVTANEEIMNLNSSHHLSASNHQSYLDVIIIASMISTLFVAKKDVQSWPILGWLASLGGTLYIDRKAFRGAKNSMIDIEKALLNNCNVHIFPEGTSSNGETIFPFRSSLFNAALNAHCAVLPITVNYEMINGEKVNISNRDLVCWYGDMTFISHFWNLLQITSCTVRIIRHESINSVEHQSPKDLSTISYHAVYQGFIKIV
jgi:1-acyl-sn-glycerol-3-phosphate acyltransferase